MMDVLGLHLCEMLVLISRIFSSLLAVRIPVPLAPHTAQKVAGGTGGGFESPSTLQRSMRKGYGEIVTTA